MYKLILGAALVLLVQAERRWGQGFLGQAQRIAPVNPHVQQFRELFLNVGPQCTWVCRHGGNDGTVEMRDPSRKNLHGYESNRHHDFEYGPHGPPHRPPDRPPHGSPSDWPGYQDPYQSHNGYPGSWNHPHHHSHHDHHGMGPDWNPWGHHNPSDDDDDDDDDDDHNSGETEGQDNSSNESCDGNVSKRPVDIPETTTPNSEDETRSTIESQPTTMKSQDQPLTSTTQAEQSTTPGQNQPVGTDFNWNDFFIGKATPNNTGGSGIIDVRFGKPQD